MGLDDNHISYAELIQSYLENEATSTEEAQFRLLLGEESFRRLAAEYSIDLGHICDLARHGMLERSLPDKRKSSRRWSWRALATTILAGSVLLAVGTMFLVQGERQAPQERATNRGAASPSPERQWDRSPFARVTDVTGRVLTLGGVGSKVPRIVRKNTELRAGDVLRTVGAGSFALLKFADNTIVAVAGDTELKCCATGSQKRIEILGGDVLAQVVPQPRGKPLLIETPTAQAEVLGTKLSVFASLVVTKLAVLEGHVRMKRLSDGSVIDVQGGHTAIASATDPFAARPLSPVTCIWEEDFEQGVPANWEHGSFVSEAASDGDRGAIRATVPEGSRNDPDSQFFVASPRDWWRGLFRIEDDTHFNFTYKVRELGWFNVMIETRSDDSSPAFSGAFLYKNPAMWTTELNRWRTVSVPLRFFHSPLGARIQRGAPAKGDLVFRFYFSTQETDPGLVIDRIWITRGAAESAEVLSPWK